MEFSETLDLYCERMTAGLWAEPVNALTNLAFLIAAGIIAARLRTGAPPLAWPLVMCLAAIGIGSGLWHTVATGWAALSDVIPILLFVLIYLYAVNRHLLGASVWLASFSVLGFFPYALLTGSGFARLPFFEISSAYWTICLLIAGYAVVLWRRRPALARGMALGAGLLTVSLIARSVDEAVCAALPLGTHFLWHLLNAVMLGWMIELYRREGIAGRRAQG